MMPTKERNQSAKSTEVVRAATFGEVVHVPLAQIVRNPWQPRRMLDPDRVGELAESIHTHGLLQPPAGRMVDKGKGLGVELQLAFGHYRVEAIRRLVDAGRWTGDVPVSVLELDDAGMFMTALTENTARTELSQLETYMAYARALEQIEGLTVQGLADSIGVDRSTLSNNLRILDLPDFVLKHVESGDMAPRAARELLAFKGKDHVHEREMAFVIEDISQTYVGTAPDWRTENVRHLMRRAIMRFDNDWRPMEGREGDHAEFGNEGGGFQREPTFDVEAFTREHGELVHILPRRDGKTRAWTCDMKEWRRLQSAATRDANKTAGTTGKVSVHKSDAGRKRAGQGKAAIARDPLVKAVRAEVPKAERGAGGELSVAEREKLGVRGEDPKVLGYKDFHESLEDLPDWFPDRAECLERCTIGAAYVTPWQGGKVQLMCTNQKNWNDKRSRGIAQLREDLNARHQAEDAEDAELVKVLGPTFTFGVDVARLTARAMLATVNFTESRPDEVSARDRQSREFDYMPNVLATAIDTLGLKVTGDPWRDSMIDREASVAALEKLGDAHVPALTAQLVVWCIRHTHLKDEYAAAVEGFGPFDHSPMDPKDAGVINFDGGLYYASLSADHPTAHIIDGSKPLCGTEALAKSMVAHRDVPQKVCARCEKVRAKREADAKAAGLEWPEVS